MRETVRAIILRDDQILVMQRNRHGDMYYTLIGGAIEPGEKPDISVVREVLEETSLRVKPETVKLVFQYEAGAPYGTQQIYLCEADGDEIVLDKNTPEAASNLLGEDLYTPMWVPIDQLLLLPFRPKQVAQAIQDAVKQGFPEDVKTI